MRHNVAARDSNAGRSEGGAMGGEDWGEAERGDGLADPVAELVRGLCERLVATGCGGSTGRWAGVPCENLGGGRGRGR